MDVRIGRGDCNCGDGQLAQHYERFPRDDGAAVSVVALVDEAKLRREAERERESERARERENVREAAGQEKVGHSSSHRSNKPRICETISISSQHKEDTEGNPDQINRC